jgi:acyl carrier protein
MHHAECAERKNFMFDKLTDIILNYVEVRKEDIRPESRFIEDLGFTSFDFMSMMGEVEDELDIEIDQEEAVNIRTVQEAVDYLEKLA